MKYWIKELMPGFKTYLKFVVCVWAFSLFMGFVLRWMMVEPFAIMHVFKVSFWMVGAVTALFVGLILMGSIIFFMMAIVYGKGRPIKWIKEQGEENAHEKLVNSIVEEWAEINKDSLNEYVRKRLKEKEEE